MILEGERCGRQDGGFRIGLSIKSKAQALANRAARAIRADQVSTLDRFGLAADKKLGRNAVIVLAD